MEGLCRLAGCRAAGASDFSLEQGKVECRAPKPSVVWMPASTHGLADTDLPILAFRYSDVKHSLSGADGPAHRESVLNAKRR